MAEYVEIAVNVPQVTGVFDYHLPPELVGRVKVGHLVEVPFGRREVYGVVFSLLDQPSVHKTKAVLDVVDPEAALTPHQIEFAKILAKNYLATLSSCIGLMLPVGLKSQADILYTAIGQISDDLTPPQARLWKLLNKRGPLRGQQIERSMKRVKWRLSAGVLIRRGFITSQSVLPPPNPFAGAWQSWYQSVGTTSGDHAVFDSRDGPRGRFLGLCRERGQHF
jgi:primosomal protein N' (replication factor Y)